MAPSAFPPGAPASPALGFAALASPAPSFGALASLAPSFGVLTSLARAFGVLASSALALGLLASRVEAGADEAASRAPLGHDVTNYTFSVGAFAPDYEVPSPGSYELPPIDTVSDHALVDAEGRATSLREALGGRLAVVSFIYATCGEATGCPMSTAVLRTLDRSLTTAKPLADDVAIVTISFDPERDTPERLVEMQKLRSPGSSWRFYTTANESALAPLLDDFGQQIAKLRWADGTWTGVFRHVLKVYLLDRELRVRNVYSVGFLNPELVLADLETLRLDEKKAAREK